MGTFYWYNTQHLPVASLDPGASGAIYTDADANTLGGYQIDDSDEVLHADGDIHNDWDGESDIEVKIVFEVNVDNTGGNDTDTVDIKAVAFYKGSGDTTTKTQTSEVATIVGKSERYKQFVSTHTLNWDETNNIIEEGDKLHIEINLETDTSEVDDIIVNHVHIRYKSRLVRIEVE